MYITFPLIHFHYIDCSLTNEYMFVAAFNGTIKLNAPKTTLGDSKNCMYKIVAAYPNTKVSLTCTSKSDKINLVVSLCHSCVNSCRIQESYIIQWEFHISFNFIQIASDFKNSAGATLNPILGQQPKQGEVYTSTDNYFDINLRNNPDATQNVVAECTFQSFFPK